MATHRTLAIGDVHGCSAALSAVLAAANPGPDDLVVPLGDYVDRGPDSAGVISTLIDLAGRCHLIPLRGNHDLTMLHARRDERERQLWLSLGGDATLRSYGGSLADVPGDHWAFLGETCVDSVETATHLFVHGGLVPDRPVERHTPFELQWTPFPPAGPHRSGKVVVCGHTRQRGDVPVSVGHAICLDTGADDGGWMTVMDVATGHYWQANQAGQMRQGALPAVGDINQ